MDRENLELNFQTPKMECATTSAVPSRWPDLPSDVLITVATLLGPIIGFLRLRSVCHSWRSSLLLPPSSPPSPHFPLPLPSLSSTSALSLHQHTIFLLSPPSDPTHSFLLKLHPNPNNTFTLLNPLSPTPRNNNNPTSPVSLLHYRVVVISHSYAVQLANPSRVSGLGFMSPIKKVVVQRGFFQENDFVVLGLTDLGGLLFWRFGDVGWTQIGQSGRRFDDIVAYKGGFYATADQRGRLVMIDSLRVVDMVNGLLYGSGKRTALVESDGGLYLVDYVRGDDEKVEIGVFKLDDKGMFWDYELGLDDNVFFVGSDVSFVVSRRDYCGEVRNCVYFMANSPEGRDFVAVFDMERNNVVPVLGSDKYSSLY